MSPSIHPLTLPNVDFRLSVLLSVCNYLSVWLFFYQYLFFLFAILQYMHQHVLYIDFSVSMAAYLTTSYPCIDHHFSPSISFFAHLWQKWNLVLWNQLRKKMNISKHQWNSIMIEVILIVITGHCNTSYLDHKWEILRIWLFPPSDNGVICWEPGGRSL